MRVTNRIEIHRRRIWFMKLYYSGMSQKDISVYFNVSQTAIHKGITRLNELIKVYGNAVLNESWAHRSDLKAKDGESIKRRTDN